MKVGDKQKDDLTKEEFKILMVSLEIIDCNKFNQVELIKEVKRFFINFDNKRFGDMINNLKREKFK